MANNFDGLHLPLDLLLLHDVDALEDALSCKYAVEHEQEIQFCEDDDDLQSILEDLDPESVKYYEIDEIESDRINAIIDLLNKAEEDNILGHILDRIIR